MWCCRSAAAHRRCLCLLLHHVVSTARWFYAAAQLEGESGQRLTALFNNDIGPSLFLKADVRRRNCTWATCGGGSARTGAACAGASATVCVQDNDGIYRSGWVDVSKHHSCFMFQMSHVTLHTSHVTHHMSHFTPQRVRKIARDAGRRKGAQRRIPTAVLPQKSKRVLKRDKCACANTTQIRCCCCVACFGGKQLIELAEGVRTLSCRK